MFSQNAFIDSFGLTHKGKVRSVNQDQYLIGSIRRVMDVERSSLVDAEHDTSVGRTMAQLLLVADGVGGCAAGGQASGLATTTFADYVTHSMSCFYHLDNQHRDKVLDQLTSGLRLSHARVRSAAQQDSELTGMATTLTVAYVLWPRAYVVHVGDSRCYLMREQELSQITKDQTVAQNLFDRGTFTAEDLERSPFNNVLSSAVGMNPTPVTSIVELRKGDTLLLCSDGLTKHVGNQQITEAVLTSKSAEDACERLLHDALQDGGRDNITIVVSRFGEAKVAAFRGNARQPTAGASGAQRRAGDRPLVAMQCRRVRGR